MIVAGAGAVGLSAVMAAVVRDAATIIAVDLHESRRALATELGATHAVDPQTGPLADQIREIAPAGADYAIDSTAVTAVVEQLLASLGIRGTLGLIGVPADPHAVFSVGLFQPRRCSGSPFAASSKAMPTRRRSFPICWLYMSRASSRSTR